MVSLFYIQTSEDISDEFSNFEAIWHFSRLFKIFKALQRFSDAEGVGNTTASNTVKWRPKSLQQFRSIAQIKVDVVGCKGILESLKAECFSTFPGVGAVTSLRALEMTQLLPDYSFSSYLQTHWTFTWLTIWSTVQPQYNQPRFNDYPI